MHSNYWHDGKRGPFVDCQPNTQVDRENLGGSLKFAPMSQDLPSHFFPYLFQDAYMAPLIAIKFDRPARNIAIGITCKLYAYNLTDIETGTEDEPSAVLPFNLYIE